VVGQVRTTFVLFLLLASCSTSPPVVNESRYLTLEEDQWVREVCEPKGCIVVPSPLMDMILRSLPKQRGA